MSGRHPDDSQEASPGSDVPPRSTQDEVAAPVDQLAGTVSYSRSHGESTYIPTNPESAERRSADPPVSRQVGDFEIIDEIARGGMGVVYRARQRGLNRIVALKMTLAGNFASGEERRRFLAEAEAAGQLDHPHIVPIHDVGEHGGQPFFSMGYVEGKSLREHLADGPLPTRRSAELMKMISEAVHFAHLRGIVHRDLKPSNVLIDADGQPRITDFGLAKRSTPDSSLTATGQILGTPSFMPPEQAMGRSEEVGVTADVYALGAMLYCLVTGRPPFQGASPMETLRQVIEQEPVPPRRLNAQIPLDLETICLKCLRKSPGQRYPSASDLAADIGRYLAGEPIRARRTGVVERLWKWCRRHPFPASVGAVAIVVSVGFTVYWTTRPAWLDVTVSPTTARVTLGGRPVLLQEGRGVVPFSPGRYSLEVSADEHLPSRQDVVLVRGRDNAVVVSIPLEAAVGHLQVDSRPSGSSLEIREPAGTVVYRGSTPLFSPALPSGEYDIVLSPVLYRERSVRATVPSGRRVSSLPTIVLEATFEGSESLERLRQVQRRLDEPSRSKGVAKNVPLEELLDTISKDEGIPVVVKHRTLEEEGISAATPVSFQPQGLPLKQSLADLLEPMGLAFVPHLENGKLRLEINTRSNVDEQQGETVVFPVGDLLQPGTGVYTQPDQLINALENHVPGPWQNNDGSGGTITAADDAKLITVRASWRTLLAVEEYLSELRSAQLRSVEAAKSATRASRTEDQRDVAERIFTRRREFKELTAEVESAASLPAESEVALATRRRLMQFLRRNPGTAEANSAIPLTQSLRWPADGLRSEDVTPESRSSMTLDESGRIPPGLVAVHGDARLTHWGPAHLVAYSPDGKQLASAGADLIRVWDVESGRLVRHLTGGLQYVEALQFRADGKLLAASGWTGTEGVVVLWNAETGTEIRRFSHGNMSVCALAFLPGGTLIASAIRQAVPLQQQADSPNPIVVWDADTGKIVHRLSGHTGTVSSLSAAKDGTRLLSAGSDRRCLVWSLASSEIVHSWQQPIDSPEANWNRQRSMSAIIAPDGRFAVIGSDGQSGRLFWSLDAQEPVHIAKHVWQASRSKVPVISPDSSRAAFMDGELLNVYRVGEWSAAEHSWSIGESSFDVRRQFPSEVSAYSLAWSPDGTCLATADSFGRVAVWNIADQPPHSDKEQFTGQLPKPRHALAGPGSKVWSVSISDDGQYLAGLGVRRLGVWQIGQAEPLALVGREGGERLKRLGRFSADSSELLVPGGQYQEVLRVSSTTIEPWRAPSSKRDSTGEDGPDVAPRASGRLPFEQVAASPDNTIAVGLISGRVVEIQQRIDDSAPRTIGNSDARSIAISPDGTVLAIGEQNEIALWDAASGLRRKSLRVDPLKHGSTFGPGGRLFYDEATYGLAFSPDSRRLAVADSRGLVSLYDLSANRTEPRSWMHPAAATSVAFSPDGRWLASSTLNGQVQLREIDAEPVTEHILSVGPAGGHVWQVAFTPEGRHLVTANGNGTVSVFRIADALREMKSFEVSPADSDAAPAPDLSARKPLWSDDFSDPKSGYPFGEYQKGFARGYRDGRYFISHTGSAQSYWTNGRVQENFICRVRGRIVGPVRSKWGVVVYGAAGFPVSGRGFEALLDGEGRWQVVPAASEGGRSRVPSNPLTSHSSILSGDEFNELIVSVRGREVGLYCNGAALSRPFRLDRDILPASLSLRLYSEETAEAEFDQMSVYSIP